ncbi:unnamed protein product [Oikopleura dioica]|uniref:Uncharacterized protein n=1 Tax=Oikopleura dioica TaxID=34765 RepID=E4WTL2_OIKDI|nr:unnamed protein product [Oikopleura dioica]
MRKSRRMSIVSLLTRASDNSNLRDLKNELKNGQRTQLQNLESAHSAQMELAADLVSFVTLKNRLQKEVDEKLVKLTKILTDRSQKRSAIFGIKETAENAFENLLKQEEISLNHQLRASESKNKICEEIISLADQTQKSFEQNESFLEAVHEMHKDILAQLFKTDKFVQNSEKKSRTKELALKEDFAVVKNKQNFDIARCQMISFSEEWNKKQARELSTFSQENFTDEITIIFQKIIELQEEQIAKDKNRTLIFKQSLSAIDKQEMLNSFADELKLDLEFSEKIKEKISSHDPLDECQREVQGQKLEEIRKRREGLENEKQLFRRVQNKETSLIPMVGIEDSNEEIARQILIIRKSSQLEKLKPPVLTKN